MIETEAKPGRPSSGDELSAQGLPSNAPSPAAHEPYELVIEPTSGWIAVNWKELFEFRELAYFFIWRDFATRYKQTILGPAWAVIQPAATMLVFSFISWVAKIPSPNNLPAPVVIFAAMIPWSIFSLGLSASGLSLLNSMHLVTKVYFPRLYLPVTAAGIFVVDAVLSSIVYAFVLLLYRVTPAWTVIFTPLLLVLTLVATLGVGIILSSLTLFYRDFRHVVPFLVQLLTYLSPILLPVDAMPAKYRPVLALNPMFGIIDAFRGCVLGVPIHWDCFFISTTVALVLFVFAIYYFRRTERTFADHV